MLNRVLAGLTAILAMVSGTTLFAFPLTISNTANHDISVTINGVCSHEFGVINTMTNRTVDESTLTRLCKNQASHCLAQIYHSTICRDKLIANFYFNTSKGNTGEAATVPPYHLAIQPYAAILSMT